jgi:hypothetical protein
MSHFCVLNFEQEQCIFSFMFILSVLMIFVNHNMIKMCFISDNVK